jgi:hypothetical protein
VKQAGCLYCEKKLKGRSDKKFCDYLCRSAHYNRLYADSNNLLRRTHRLLKKNRRILKDLDKEKVSYSELANLGFQFDHCTNVVQESAQTYFFCYDIGYVRLENNYFAVVSKVEESR